MCSATRAPAAARGTPAAVGSCAVCTLRLPGARALAAARDADHALRLGVIGAPDPRGQYMPSPYSRSLPCVEPATVVPLPSHCEGLGIPPVESGKQAAEHAAVVSPVWFPNVPAGHGVGSTEPSVQ